MDRPTVDVTLNHSQARVVLYTYLRNGDFRTIQKRLASDIKYSPKKDDEDIKTPEISASLVFEEQDITLELLVKEVFDKDGNQVTNIKDFLYDLRIEDGNQLYDEVNRITKDSSMTPEDKKK
jgi:hypothetical protein